MGQQDGLKVTQLQFSNTFQELSEPGSPTGSESWSCPA